MLCVGKVKRRSESVKLGVSVGQVTTKAISAGPMGLVRGISVDTTTLCVERHMHRLCFVCLFFH